MHHSQLLLWASFLVTNVAAIPFNINLGAYSPALVVGDGEISFGGKQDISNLMNALEGAAVSGAAANGAANAAPAAASPAASASASAAPAAAEPAAANVVPTEQGNTQITALQGMGKEIASRVVKFAPNEKRDINGFNAALKYASDALKTGPKIELGTENAGLGILQSPGINAPAAAATTGTAKSAARDIKQRDVQVGAKEKKLKTTVTTMFVGGGPAPAQAERIVENESAPVEKRVPSPGLDGVNLNMAEGQVAELTFVETRAVGEDDE